LEAKGVWRGGVQAYGSALTYVALAIAARYVLVPRIGAFEGFGPFYPAVLASALIGVGPGAAAALVSILVVWYFFLPPTGSFLLQDAPAFLALAIFGLCSALIVGVAAFYQRMRAANVRANELFKAVQDISLEGVVVYQAVRDARGDIIDFEYRYANPAALAIMTRSDPRRIVGQRLLERLPLARENPTLFPRYVKTVNSGETSTAEYELGGRWFHSTVAKLDDGLVVTVQDVSDRRRGEDAQRLLLQELNHRVKNLLASVIAMATVTGRGASSVAEFRDKLLGRFSALSRAHGLLTARAWTDAAVHDVVRSTLEPHLQADPGRFSIEGPAIAISADAALALNMALYELATNAVKYGALSTVQGRVGVAWRVDPDQSGFVLLTWTETGGPPVESPGRPGFGARLLEQAFAAEGGSAKLGFAPDGVRCEMRFKGLPRHASSEEIIAA
jgi:two-component sensor histidine kinase